MGEAESTPTQRPRARREKKQASRNIAQRPGSHQDYPGFVRKVCGSATEALPFRAAVGCAGRPLESRKQRRHTRRPAAQTAHVRAEAQAEGSTTCAEARGSISKRTRLAKATLGHAEGARRFRGTCNNVKRERQQLRSSLICGESIQKRDQRPNGD